MNRIILPSGQHINPQNTTVLQSIINKMANEHKERLRGIRKDLQTLDMILQESLKQNDIFKEKLTELGVDTKDLLNGK